MFAAMTVGRSTTTKAETFAQQFKASTAPPHLGAGSVRLHLLIHAPYGVSVSMQPKADKIGVKPSLGLLPCSLRMAW